MRNYTIMSVWGIPIRINISLIVFLPVLAWLIGSGEQIPLYAGYIEDLVGTSLRNAPLMTGNTPWLIGGLAAIGLFVSVTVHELGHSWMALRYGIEIESITLWIFGGIASLAQMPKEWNRELWIALAGPAVSVLLAVAFYGIALTIPASQPVVLFVVGWLAITNVALTAFNLLPAFPMDGGRVLRALLARTQPYAVATRRAAKVGRWFAIVFAVIGILSLQIILVLVALFIYGAAASESRMVLLDELLEGVTVADIGGDSIDAVEADASIAQLLDRMTRERRTAFPVTQDGDVVGIVSLGDLKGQRGDRETTTVRSVMRGDIPRVELFGDAFDTLALIGQSGATHALIVDGGRVVGVLSQEDFARAIDLQKNVQAGLPAP